MHLQRALFLVEQPLYYFFMVAVRIGFAPKLHCQAVTVVLVEFVDNSLLRVVAAKFLQFCSFLELKSKGVVNFGQ